MGFYDRQRVALYGEDNLVECPICHKLYARLGTHAVQKHGFASAKEFKAKYVMSKKEMSCSNYRERMKEHTLTNGTFKNCEFGKDTRLKHGDNHLVKKWWDAKRNVGKL